MKNSNQRSVSAEARAGAAAESAPVSKPNREILRNVQPEPIVGPKKTTGHTFDPEANVSRTTKKSNVSEDEFSMLADSTETSSYTDAREASVQLEDQDQPPAQQTEAPRSFERVSYTDGPEFPIESSSKINHTRLSTLMNNWQQEEREYGINDTPILSDNENQNEVSDLTDSFEDEEEDLPRNYEEGESNDQLDSVLGSEVEIARTSSQKLSPEDLIILQEIDIQLAQVPRSLAQLLRALLSHIQD